METAVILTVKKRPKWHLDILIIKLYRYFGLNNQMMNHYSYVMKDLEVNFDRYFKVITKLKEGK